MSTTAAKNFTRINVTLPPETLRLLDRVVKKGNRSKFIDEAVRFYSSEFTKARLRRRLREGARNRAQRDRQMAEEWLALETGVWRQVKE